MKKFLSWYNRFTGVPEHATKQERKLYLWMQAANWFLPIIIIIQIIFFDSRPVENPVLFYGSIVVVILSWSIYFGSKYKKERKKRQL
jgi:hypothetical protein